MSARRFSPVPCTLTVHVKDDTGQVISFRSVSQALRLLKMCKLSNSSPRLERRLGTSL